MLYEVCGIYCNVYLEKVRGLTVGQKDKKIRYIFKRCNYKHYSMNRLTHQSKDCNNDQYV